MSVREKRENRGRHLRMSMLINLIHPMDIDCSGKVSFLEEISLW